MSMIRTFKLPVSPWVINKLLNTKYLMVQRLAMYSNIMLSSDNDLDYFETDFFDKHCCIRDEIELAYSLQRRRKAGLKLPNLARWANLQKNERSQCMFVRLMRRFDELEYCDQLVELFKNQPRKKKLIEEISRTWGYLHFTDGEDLLMDALLTQPDDTKVAIMHALTRFATGRSLSSLLEGFQNTTNPHVRFEALRCMYNYGEEGRDLFEDLEKNAKEEDKKFHGAVGTGIVNNDNFKIRIIYLHQRIHIIQNSNLLIEGRSYNRNSGCKRRALQKIFYRLVIRNIHAYLVLGTIAHKHQIQIAEHQQHGVAEYQITENVIYCNPHRRNQTYLSIIYCFY